MAFKKWKKAVSKRPPFKIWSSKQMKIIGWCMKNNIYISTTPNWRDDFGTWFIHIKINGTLHNDPKCYKEEEVLNKILEYYKYYYDKYNKQ